MLLLQESVDVPEPPEMLVGLRLQTRLGELVATARVTVPVNPLREVTLIVEDPATPVCVVTDCGLAEILKSGVPLKMLEEMSVELQSWERHASPRLFSIVRRV